MNIAHVVPVFFKKNEEYIYLMIKALAETGCNQTVFSSKFQNLIDNRIEVQRELIFGRDSGLVIDTYLKVLSNISGLFKQFEPISFNKKLNSFNADIIHAHFGMSACNLINEKKPTLISMHGFDGNVAIKSHKILNAYRVIANRDNVYFTFPSKHFRNSVVEKIGINQEKTFILKNPVNIEQINGGRIENNTPELKILCIGRYICVKNQEFLIKAMPKLRDKGIKSKLILIGFGPDLDYLKKMSRDLKVDGNVDFIINPERDEIIEKLLQANLYVQPSRYDPITGAEETFCISIMEALAAGCYTLVNEYGAIKEIYEPLNKEGTGFYYYKENNMNDFINKALYIFEKKPKVDNKLVSNFLSSFKPLIIAHSLKKIYENIIQH